MSITTPAHHPASPAGRQPPSPPYSGVSPNTGNGGFDKRATPTRRRGLRAALGSFPIANVVVLECGLTVGLILITSSTSLKYVAIGVLALALAIAVLRFRGKWVVEWAWLSLRYRLRQHARVTKATAQEAVAVSTDVDSVIGAADARIDLLRLVVPDLFVTHGIDHERQQVGFAWHNGCWIAVLLVESTPPLVVEAASAADLPMSALGPCLENRGVILDSIQVVWHCYPGSTVLPVDSPALRAYLELLGPLPAAARRTTWIALRLDPRRCPVAIQERGGGTVGAHRALIGAVSRTRNALESRGIPARPLDPNELLRACISAAELTAVAGSGNSTKLAENWTGITAAGIRHSSYAITSWPRVGAFSGLNALLGVRTLSTTVALSISPVSDEKRIGLRGVVRLSARDRHESDMADERLSSITTRLGISLAPLHGLQIHGLASTLPLGGVG